MSNERFTVINAYGLGDMLSLVVFHSRDYPGRLSPLSATEALSANGDTELQKSE